MFKSQLGGPDGQKRMNLAGDDIHRFNELHAVSENTDTVFSLKNYDVLTLDCQSLFQRQVIECVQANDNEEGHPQGSNVSALQLLAGSSSNSATLNYRTNMQLIFQFIEFRL